MIPDHRIAELVRLGVIGYTPYDAAMLNPASIDMTLDRLIRVPSCDPFGQYDEIDMAAVREGHTHSKVIGSEGWVMSPNDFILGSTVERVHLPDNTVARVEGKSSIGRVGLAVHITAGFIDPGFDGQVTLEIANLSPWQIRLHAGMRIAQMAFTLMETSSLRPYSNTGHYMGQLGPTESRYKMAAV